MESLALAAAIVMLSVIGFGLLALTLTCLGVHGPAAFVGLLSVASGAWWMHVLPVGFPVLGLFNMSVGILAICRWIYARE